MSFIMSQIARTKVPSVCTGSAMCQYPASVPAVPCVSLGGVSAQSHQLHVPDALQVLVTLLTEYRWRRRSQQKKRQTQYHFFWSSKTSTLPVAVIVTPQAQPKHNMNTQKPHQIG